MQKWASKGDGAFHAADRCLGKRGVLKVRNRQPLLEHNRGKVKHNPVFNVALLWGLRFTDRADDSITALIQNSGFCEWTMITQQSDRGTSGSSTKQHFFCWKQLPTTINPLRRLWLSKVSKRCVLAEVWALEFLLLYYKKTFKESVVIFPNRNAAFHRFGRRQSPCHLLLMIVWVLMEVASEEFHLNLRGCQVKEKKQLLFQEEVYWNQQETSHLSSLSFVSSADTTPVCCGETSLKAGPLRSVFTKVQDFCRWLKNDNQL